MIFYEYLFLISPLLFIFISLIILNGNYPHPYKYLPFVPPFPSNIYLISFCLLLLLFIPVPIEFLNIAFYVNVIPIVFPICCLGKDEELLNLFIVNNYLSFSLLSFSLY